MIRSLRLMDFKNFDDETLRVGPFTVIVGANASGKSNIRDAFRFLHGIGRGYTVAEIVGGKYGAGGQEEWMPIRGATNEIVRIMASTGGVPAPSKPGFGLEIELATEHGTATYSIEASTEIHRSGFRITHERLQVAGETIYEKPRSTHGVHRVIVGDARDVDVNPDRPALLQLLETRQVLRNECDKERIRAVVSCLESMRFMEFSPGLMREPSFPSQTVLGDQGANLSAVLKEVCEEPKQKSIFTEWIRELTPMDVKDLDFPLDRSGRVHLEFLEEGGARVSAYSASDGTLRFLAMLATLLGKDPASLYFFEEIDNGIHPARLRLLLELIERQTAKHEVQVVTTTHSTDLLSMLGEPAFENTSVVCRPEGRQDAIIRAVRDLPNAGKLRSSQGLGRLLAGGWMETALAFTEGSEDDEDAME